MTNSIIGCIVLGYDQIKSNEPALFNNKDGNIEIIFKDNDDYKSKLIKKDIIKAVNFNSVMKIESTANEKKNEEQYQKICEFIIQIQNYGFNIEKPNKNTGTFFETIVTFQVGEEEKKLILKSYENSEYFVEGFKKN